MWGDEPELPPSLRTTEYDHRLLVNDQLKQVEDAGDIAYSMGYPSWNLLYYSLFCSLPHTDRDVTIVETGTNEGLSTIVLAQALHDSHATGKIYTVDLSEEFVSQARRNVANAGLEDLVDFSVADSVTFLRGLGNRVSSVDFAFIDASHEYDDVIREFKALYPLVRNGGTVYFDNTSAGGVRDALEVIKLRYGGNLLRFNNCSWSPPGNAIWQPGRRSRLLPRKSR